MNCKKNSWVNNEILNCNNQRKIKYFYFWINVFRQDYLLSIGKVDTKTADGYANKKYPIEGKN